MIAGVGTDLCLISRMRRAIGSGGFVRRVFVREEIDYADSRAEPERHYASAFAAKEALAKATGLGVFGVGLAMSWVRRTEEGPVMLFEDALREKLDGMGIGSCWLSLAHDGDYALAFVVLERAS
ncbi:MAG: holo-ACP synthase [Synergistaceae bacterium]|jgi:holo-[acyl-carrier protein] synthase|nr:holo-ACP synthase [Synergistaceae bacterium]